MRKADEPLQYFSNRLQQSANALEHAHTYWILANLYRNEGNAEQEVDCLKKQSHMDTVYILLNMLLKPCRTKNIIVNPAAPLRYKNKINIVFYLICLACIIMMLIDVFRFLFYNIFTKIKASVAAKNKRDIRTKNFGGKQHA